MKLSAAKGEYAPAGQNLMMFVPTHIWVTANFKEKQITDMRPVSRLQSRLMRIRIVRSRSRRQHPVWLGNRIQFAAGRKRDGQLRQGCPTRARQNRIRRSAFRHHARSRNVGRSRSKSTMSGGVGKSGNPWLIAWIVSIATFMEVLDVSIANVALRHIAGSMGASYDQATWILTSYLVANAAILPASAWLSSVLGRKRFYMLCVAVFTVSSLLCGLAWNLGSLIFFRVL